MTAEDTRTAAGRPAPPRGLAGAALRALGLAIQALALYYVARSIFLHTPEFAGVVQPGPVYAGGVLLLGLLYALVLILPALGWGLLLLDGDDSPPGLPAAVRTYFATALAKYIPGNVFHYLSRQLAGGRLGWAQAGIARASLHEVILVVAACALLALPVAPFLALPALPWLPPKAALLSLLGLAVLLPFTLPWVGRFMGNRVSALSGASVAPGLDALLRAFAAYFAFVISSGLLFFGVLLLGEARPQLSDLPYCVAVYGVIYVLAYLTPGAPGGLGVREALLILFVGPLVGAAAATAAALVFRMVNVVGEVVGYLAARGSGHDRAR